MLPACSFSPVREVLLPQLFTSTSLKRIVSLQPEEKHAWKLQQFGETSPPNLLSNCNFCFSLPFLNLQTLSTQLANCKSRRKQIVAHFGIKLTHKHFFSDPTLKNIFIFSYSNQCKRNVLTWKPFSHASFKRFSPPIFSLTQKMMVATATLQHTSTQPFPFSNRSVIDLKSGSFCWQKSILGNNYFENFCLVALTISSLTMQLQTVFQSTSLQTLPTQGKLLLQSHFNQNRETSFEHLLNQGNYGKRGRM